MVFEGKREINRLFSVLSKFFKVFNHFLTTYLSRLLTIGFLIPLIAASINSKNFDEIINLIEVFVLVSATLSLLSFTYVMAIENMKEKVLKSVLSAGELFFMSTVQFIVGLFLLFILNAFGIGFLPVSTLKLSFNLNDLMGILIFIFQIAVIFEIVFALSKFFKGVTKVYWTFRIEGFASIIQSSRENLLKIKKNNKEKNKKNLTD